MSTVVPVVRDSGTSNLLEHLRFLLSAAQFCFLYVIMLRSLIMKIYNSPESIYPVAKQRENNKLINTHTQPFNGPFSGTTRVSRYQKGKTNLDFTEARDSEWQWHQLGYMQVCTLLQTDNHASTSPLCFLQAGCPSCRQTNSVKAMKAE